MITSSCQPCTPWSLQNCLCILLHGTEIQLSISHVLVKVIISVCLCDWGSFWRNRAVKFVIHSRQITHQICLMSVFCSAKDFNLTYMQAYSQNTSCNWLLYVQLQVYHTFNAIETVNITKITIQLICLSQKILSDNWFVFHRKYCNTWSTI